MSQASTRRRRFTTNRGSVMLLVPAGHHDRPAVGSLCRFFLLLGHLEAPQGFERFTLGGFWGLPGERLRVMANYEIPRIEELKHDHKLYLWVQGMF
jgi:hypothetical protein